MALLHCLCMVDVLCSRLEPCLVSTLPGLVKGFTLSKSLHGQKLIRSKSRYRDIPHLSLARGTESMGYTRHRFQIAHRQRGKESRSNPKNCLSFSFSLSTKPRVKQYRGRQMRAPARSRGQPFLSLFAFLSLLLASVLLSSSFIKVFDFDIGCPP